MKKCCIGFGKCSSLFLYVFYCILSHFIGDFIVSLEIFDFHIIEDKKVNQDKKDYIPELKNHIDIKSLYNFIGFIIFGTLFLYFSKKDKEKKIITKKNENLVTTNFIYDENKISPNISVFKVLIICFIFIFHFKKSDIKYTFDFSRLDFWIFNTIFTFIFMYRSFNIKQYTHQILSLIFIFTLDFILTIIYSLLPRNNSENIYQKIGKLFHNKLYSIPIILFFIIISCLISYARVEAKILMEIKYLSPYKFIIITGIIGFILISISLIISSIIECEGENAINYCNVKYNYNNNTIFYDSFPVYFSNLRNRSIPILLIDIVIIPFYIFANFLQFLFEILMIYYLNPVYILISDALYYMIYYLISYIIKSNDIYNFIVTISMDLVAIFGYFIYIELIELRFCGFNKNLKKLIFKRGKLESEKIENELINVKEGIEESEYDENESIN